MALPTTPSFGLEGRRALVTGGSRGIGRAAAAALAQEGAKVTIEKQVLAWWLRSRTSVSCRWIGERLGMGDESSVSRAVGVVRDGKERRVRRWQRVLGRLEASAIQGTASEEGE